MESKQNRNKVAAGWIDADYYLHISWVYLPGRDSIGVRARLQHLSLISNSLTIYAHFVSHFSSFAYSAVIIFLAPKNNWWQCDRDSHSIWIIEFIIFALECTQWHICGNSWIPSAESELHMHDSIVFMLYGNLRCSIQSSHNIVTLSKQFQWILYISSRCYQIHFVEDDKKNKFTSFFVKS